MMRLSDRDGCRSRRTKEGETRRVERSQPRAATRRGASEGPFLRPLPFFISSNLRWDLWSRAFTDWSWIGKRGLPPRSVPLTFYR